MCSCSALSSGGCTNCSGRTCLKFHDYMWLFITSKANSSTLKTFDVHGINTGLLFTYPTFYIMLFSA